MRLRDHARLLSITLSAIALAATATLPAAASDKPIPGQRTIDSAPEEKTQGVPASVYDSLEAVQRKIDQLPEFNHYEWDEDSSQLVVHHHGKAERLSTTLTSALPAGAFSLVEDRYSVKELQKESDRIVAAHLTIGGAPVISAGPTDDADGLVVQIESDHVELLRGQPDTSSVSPYPIVVERSQPAEKIDRQYDPIAPHWGGALMSRTTSPGMSAICTTGFGVGFMSGSTLMTRNLTADHCGSTGTLWRTGNYSDSALLGVFSATNSGGSDLKLINPPAGTSTSFGGVIYNGAWNSNTGLGIKGAVAPILNDYWCFSGSQSGMVCNNKVTEINKSICYGVGGLGPCYNQMAISVQQDGISAAGNGDSGGPVVAARNNYAYAAGIISGIRNGGTSCQGLPATTSRKCSATVITAPVQAFFNANPSYGILTNGQ